MGQVAEAFSRIEWYEKWGIHFLPSLLTAHRSQQCNNYKDPGVQHYGGELFMRLRDEAEEIFCNLEAPRPGPRPPPPPAAAAVNQPGLSHQVHVAPFPQESARQARAAPLADMSSYYDRYGG